MVNCRKERYWMVFIQLISSRTSSTQRNSINAIKTTLEKYSLFLLEKYPLYSCVRKILSILIRKYSLPARKVLFLISSTDSCWEIIYLSVRIMLSLILCLRKYFLFLHFRDKQNLLHKRQCFIDISDTNKFDIYLRQ